MRVIHAKKGSDRVNEELVALVNRARLQGQDRAAAPGRSLVTADRA